MKATLRPSLVLTISVLAVASAFAESPGSDSRVLISFAPSAHEARAGHNAPDSQTEAALADLGCAMQKMAAHYLPATMALGIKVREVDFAGDSEWQHGPSFNSVRFMPDIYPPRMTLEYHLQEHGRVIAQGEAKLTNPEYLTTENRFNSDPLRYEKALFRDWISAQFSQYHR